MVRPDDPINWRARRAGHIASLLAVLIAPAGATQPLIPLASPLYSFDLASPACIGGFVEADDVLGLNFPFPIPIVPAAVLGLGAPGDDLDALSGPNLLVASNATFSLMFSVTRSSPGFAPPDPGLVAAGYPYNVADQAARGHQAGDAFMSTSLYTSSAGREPNSGPDNSTMIRNNYDEGGSDFAGRPETSAHTMAIGEPQDNVDAIADLLAAVTTYYSVSSTSPSLATLPGSATPSGARIFRRVTGVTEYAGFGALGLVQADDIDALVVFDRNANGQFDGSDEVIFSLTPGSPSLTTILGASPVAAPADVFRVAPGEAPELFASAASLGLGDPSDDIDALEILLCEDAAACALNHAIRLLAGDFDGNGTVDALDYVQFTACFSLGSLLPGCEPADVNRDSEVDCADYGGFVSGWTAGQPIPSFSECNQLIPAASHWSLTVTALLLLIAATRRLGRTAASPVR